MRLLNVLSCAIAAPLFMFSAIVVPAQAEQANSRLVVQTTFQPALSTYRVTMVQGSNKQFASGEGSFTEKLSMGCDGWRTEQRLYVKFMPVAAQTDPRVLPVYLRTGANTFESRDGLTYEFADKSSLGGNILSSHRGSATLSASGQAGTATYSEPAGQTVQLPAGTVFPTKFAYQLITAAGNGQSGLEALVFDGSMGAEFGVLKLSAAIGLPQNTTYKLDAPPANARINGNTSMDQFGTSLAWPVRINLYSAANPASGLLFQQGQSLMQNGRTEDMLMDFGQFKLRFELVKMQPLPMPACN